MIPWSEVDGTNRYWDAIYPVDLQEHWLRLVENGPSMATWVLDSPMLELAHERQFVISQEGGDSVGFELEHVERIKLCLTVLDQNFCIAAGWKQYHLYNPPDVDHVGLWATDQSLDVPTTLDLSEDEPMMDPVGRASKRDDPSLIATIHTSYYQSRTSVTPLYIQVSESGIYENGHDGVQSPSIKFPRATGSRYPTQTQPPRALKPVRLRKQLNEKKKPALSCGIQKTNAIQVLSNKSCVSRSENARNALLSASAVSLSAPPASGPEDSDHDELDIWPHIFETNGYFAKV